MKRKRNPQNITPQNTIILIFIQLPRRDFEIVRLGHTVDVRLRQPIWILGISLDRKADTSELLRWISFVRYFGLVVLADSITVRIFKSLREYYFECRAFVAILKMFDWIIRERFIFDFLAESQIRTPIDQTGLIKSLQMSSLLRRSSRRPRYFTDVAWGIEMSIKVITGGIFFFFSRCESRTDRIGFIYFNSPGFVPRRKFVFRRVWSSGETILG